MKILVMSCDKNNDLWMPFYYCMEKYWPDHPEIIYSTETLTNQYYKTILKNYDVSQWTCRLYETLKEIDDNLILIMVDDIFIKGINLDKWNQLLNNLPDNFASINFESSYDKDDSNYSSILKKRSSKGRWKISAMCSLWNKEILIKLLDNVVLNPWKFETDIDPLNYEYYILKELILDWGHYKLGDMWGVYRGKWTSQALEFFKSENLTINSERLNL